MDISSNAAVGAAITAAQSTSAGTAQALVLGVALNSQAQNTAALIQSIPQNTALASSGVVGTRLNTYA
jgi:hypothetical protein